MGMSNKRNQTTADDARVMTLVSTIHAGIADLNAMAAELRAARQGCDELQARAAAVLAARSR